MDRYDKPEGQQHPPLYTGQKVYVQHKAKLWEPRIIRHSATEPRSYIVESADESIHRRNRQFLNPDRSSPVPKNRKDQLPITDANIPQIESPHSISVNVPSSHRSHKRSSSSIPSQVIISESQALPIEIKQLTTESHSCGSTRPTSEPWQTRRCIKIHQRIDL